MWIDILEALANKFRPVTNGQDQVASMDEIEAVFLERPLLFDIIDFKAAVWSNPIYHLQTGNVRPQAEVSHTIPVGLGLGLHLVSPPMDIDLPRPIPIFLKLYPVKTVRLKLYWK